MSHRQRVYQANARPCGRTASCSQTIINLADDVLPFRAGHVAGPVTK